MNDITVFLEIEAVAETIENRLKEIEAERAEIWENTTTATTARTGWFSSLKTYSVVGIEAKKLAVERFDDKTSWDKNGLKELMSYLKTVASHSDNVCVELSLYHVSLLTE